MLMDVILIATLCLEQWVIFIFCPWQELRPSLTEKDFERSSKKRGLHELRRSYIQKTTSLQKNVGVWVVEAVQDSC